MAIAAGAETRVNTFTAYNQDDPRIAALADGGWVVAWLSNGQEPGQGIYQQAYNPDGTPRGTETHVNTYTANDQHQHQIAALAGGGWVVAWRSYGQDGSLDGVYQQVYDANGSASGSETRINTYTAGPQDMMSITSLAGGGWVVAWRSYQDGSEGGIHQQAYGADGSPLGNETQVNTYTTEAQFLPEITSLAGGGWVVTWQSNRQDGSGYGIYQQAYRADGSLSGGEARVNAHTAGNQSYTQIIGLAGGGWVVAWTSDGQDGNDSGVYQQAYNANGSLLGGETQVNTYTAGGQASPKLTALKGGGWVVTWQSAGQDGSGWGVYQRAFSANGSSLGGETRVNSYTAHDQAGPEITALVGGGWVATWVSYDQEEDASSGIYQQAYDANGSPVGAEMRVNVIPTYAQGNPASPCLRPRPGMERSLWSVERAAARRSAARSPTRSPTAWPPSRTWRSARRSPTLSS